MNKNQINLDQLPTAISTFDENSNDEYWNNVSSYFAENTNHLEPVFDSYPQIFIPDATILNYLKFVTLLIMRIGSPAFFILENSKLLDLLFDPSTQLNEVIEFKRIVRYCLSKFTKMNVADEIPNLNRKYRELCQLFDQENDLLVLPLSDFEQNYSILYQSFKTFEQELQSLKEKQGDSEQREKIIQILEKIDSIYIQPYQQYSKAENELILNFFHERYNLINIIQNDYNEYFREYEQRKAEKKTQEKQQKDQVSISSNPAYQTTQGIGFFTSFIEGYSLVAYPESLTLEYKDYIYPFRNEELKKKLKATICAFLNTSGGRMFIGVHNEGLVVKGLFLNSTDQDNLVRDIDTLLKDFSPKVEPEEVQTVFIPVKKSTGEYKPGFYVVKIIVKKGKPNDVYFTGRDCYKRRNGITEVQMPSYFKPEIVSRSLISIQSNPELFVDNGEYADLQPEIGIPVPDLKDKMRKEREPKQIPKVQINRSKHSPPQQNFSKEKEQKAKLLIKNFPVENSDLQAKIKVLLAGLSCPGKFKIGMNKKASIVFDSQEDMKVFYSSCNKSPLVIDGLSLILIPKDLRSSGASTGSNVSDKPKPKVEIDEEKREFERQKDNNSTVIWIRGIPENTMDLKEKIMLLLGEFVGSLKEVKVHNKKKRASIEFDSPDITNQVLSFLSSSERIVDGCKLSFEKASPPSSPNQGGQVKPKPTNSKGASEEEPIDFKEGEVLKISGVPLENPGQDVEYLVRACDHHTKNIVDYQISEKKDFILLFFRGKEEASAAYKFFTDNNFTYKGKKIQIDFSGDLKKLGKGKKKGGKKGETSVITDNTILNQTQLGLIDDAKLQMFGNPSGSVLLNSFQADEFKIQSQNNQYFDSSNGIQGNFQTSQSNAGSYPLISNPNENYQAQESFDQRKIQDVSGGINQFKQAQPFFNQNGNLGNSTQQFQKANFNQGGQDQLTQSTFSTQQSMYPNQKQQFMNQSFQQQYSEHIPNPYVNMNQFNQNTQPLKSMQKNQQKVNYQQQQIQSQNVQKQSSTLNQTNGMQNSLLQSQNPFVSQQQGLIQNQQNYYQNMQNSQLQQQTKTQNNSLIQSQTLVNPNLQKSNSNQYQLQDQQKVNYLQNQSSYGQSYQQDPYQANQFIQNGGNMSSNINYVQQKNQNSLNFNQVNASLYPNFQTSYQPNQSINGQLNLGGQYQYQPVMSKTGGWN